MGKTSHIPAYTSKCGLITGSCMRKFTVDAYMRSCIRKFYMCVFISLEWIKLDWNRMEDTITPCYFWATLASLSAHDSTGSFKTYFGSCEVVRGWPLSSSIIGRIKADRTSTEPDKFHLNPSTLVNSEDHVVTIVIPLSLIHSSWQQHQRSPIEPHPHLTEPETITPSGRRNSTFGSPSPRWINLNKVDYLFWDWTMIPRNQW